MAKEIQIVHHPDRRTDVIMPYAPAILMARGRLLFLSGVTAAAVYHSHPHRDEEFDLPATMEEQAVRAMENLKKTLEAAGCTLGDLVAATRYLTDVGEQDDLNRVWARYLGGHLPTTPTVEVSRLAKRLLDGGHRVIGYNRTREKARWLADAGMRVADSPREVAVQADVVFTM